MELLHPPPPPEAGRRPALLPRLSGVRDRDAAACLQADMNAGRMRTRPRIGINMVHGVVIMLLLVAALAASLTLLLIQAGNMRVDATNATVEAPVASSPSESSDQSVAADASDDVQGSATPADPSVDDGLVDINTAGVAQLDAVKGIGPVFAQRIVDYRNEHGRFSSVDDLLDVPGIGMKTLNAMRGQLAVR